MSNFGELLIESSKVKEFIDCIIKKISTGEKTFYCGKDANEFITTLYDIKKYIDKNEWNY
jgi:hypothetical protein